MEKRNKMKLIVILAVTIILSMFVISVTAQTITQYRQRCQEWDSSQDKEAITPYKPQGCCKQQSQPCDKTNPLRGCC